MITRTLNRSGVPIGEDFVDTVVNSLKKTGLICCSLDVNMSVMNDMEMLTYVRIKPETKDLPVLIFPKVVVYSESIR